MPFAWCPNSECPNNTLRPIDPRELLESNEGVRMFACPECKDSMVIIKPKETPLPVASES